MGILDTIMRHTNKDIEDEMSKSSRLADIIAQHEAAAEVQASFDWQHRRPNVGMDPGTHPVLLQAAAEKAREEQAERTRRWGQNAMMPASQLYSGVTNNKYPAVSRLDSIVRQNNMDRERKQGTVPYRNYSPLTDTMSPWLPKLTEKKEVSSEGAKKMSDMTSTLSPWLEQKSAEYAENGGNILPRENVERIAKLQGEVSDLQKQLDNLPPSHLRGLRGQKVADGINQEIGLKRQTIEMIRNEAPTKGADLTSASSAFENRLLQEETRKAEEKKSNPYLDQAHADLNYKVNPGQMPTNERLQRISEIQQELRILDPDKLESLTAPGAMRGASEEARKSVEERLKRAQSLEEELDALQKGYSYEPSTYSRLAEASEEAQKEQNRFMRIAQTRNLSQIYDQNGTIDIPDISKSARVLANEGREKAALDYVRKYENQRADTKFGANYTAGRISQDESLAWNDYLRNPSEANRRYAETISAVGAKYQANNADIMQKDDSVAGLITEDFARYVPQMIDQFKYEALPMLFGAMVGGDKGMKVGRLIGSAAYSMETMSGAAFKNLLDAGVDEETARKACKNEAFLSTIIECADEIVDMFTTGFGKASSALFGTPVKGFDSVLQKFVGSSTWKKWAVRLGKYGLNVLSEANEEGSQEAISIANEKRMAEGKEISLTGLAMDAIKIYIDAIFNKDSENRERIGEAAAGGARLALVNMPMESAGNAALYAGSTLRSGQKIRANNQINETIENGLYNDPNSRAYQLAQRVQTGQEQTGGNRLQEIARQMQQDFRVGQLEQENRANEAEIREADTLVRTLAEKAATGEHITKSEVAEILGNDLAVQELETASGQQISTIENRPERVETVRNALSVAAENYQAASSLENAERMNPLSTVTGTAGNGPFSGSEDQSLDLTSALRNIAMSDRGQQINAGLQTMTSPRLGEITARQAALQTETRSRIMEERAQGIREDARARSVEAMNDRIERAAQASVERWTETLEEYNKSENFDNNERLEAFARETFMETETPGTSGYMTFVAEWMPGQDETQYAQEWIPYYNAGTKGTPITEVGDISTQILTQEQREHAYEAGRWDARDQIVKEVTNELGQQENTVIAGTAGTGGRTERIDSPSAGVGSGRGSIWAEEAGRRRRTQAEYAASAGDIAASEGLKAVSPNSLGIKGVSDRQSITEIPEGSALYTEEMRRLKDRAAAFGNELHFYLGTMIASDGKTEVRGSNEGRRVWVQADHPVHDAATLARHEEFHTVKRFYPRVLEMIKKKIISTYSEAELQEFTGTYVKAYGMAGMSGRDIFEEICADAYAGLDDFFEVRETGYEGATRFTDAAREASQEFEARVQEDVREGLSEQEVREREGKTEREEYSLDDEKEVKNSKNPFFEAEINEWYKELKEAKEEENESLRETYISKLGRREFIVGSTSNALRSIGMIESDIFLRGSSVNNLLNKHHPMTIKDVKAIQDIIENPVAILKSKSKITKEGSTEGTKRIVIFGNHKIILKEQKNELKEQKNELNDYKDESDDNEKRIPALVIMDVRPNSKRQNIIYTNVQEVVKSYFRGPKGFANFLEKSEWLYADKNRAVNLIRSAGIQYPTTLIKSGPIGKISYIDRNVKADGSNFEDVSENLGVEISGVPFNEVFRRTDTEPKFSRNIDSEGRQLSEAQQEYFQNSKIRDEDGNLRVVYHGTDQEFTVFDRTKGRANMDIQGMFFSPWDIDAQGYGSNVQEYYLNITNPASESVGCAALNRFKGQNNAGVKAREYLEKQGYDGVNNGDEEYIAFRPDQIKLVSNTEPTDSPDIRFSREAKPDVRFTNKEINEITRKVENGEGLTSEEEVKFSLNHDADFVEKERAFKQSFVSGDVLTASFAQREFVRNKLMQPGIRELLPEDKMGKTSFGNGSYGRSMEHSTICPRTLSMEAILDSLSEKFGRPITVDESIKISQLAWAYMDAPECAYCYVAMDRKAKREYLLNYMTSRNEVFKNIDSGMSREDAYNAFLNGRKDTKPMKDRFNNWIRMHENGSEMIEMKDLASDRAIKAASEKSKSMANQVKDALKYAQSASWAKKYVQYTAYNGEILKWNQKLVNSLNRMYGMRMYSFSDFHPAFTLEDMQMITDASLRGLKVLAYTKELDFARIMEPTGANINISVFAQGTKDANGDYGMDAMQGADWDEAKALRAKSIKNGTGIGITMVCTNDDQVDWALGQEWIDVVIPFHMVKTGAKVAEHFGWTNYTDMQGDKKLKDLWDGKVNEAMIEPPEHQNNKQLYLEALERNNLSPRFEKWVDDPNYMKLVNETRRAEGETPTVQPKFNLDAADAMFDKMQKQGGYYQHLGLETDVFEDLQDEIYDEYVEKYGTPAKFSRNRKISQDAQKTITGQQMDLEQKLMQTAELLKEANKEKEKLQKQLTEAQRNMQLSKEKSALESSVQRVAAKLLKSYDVYPDDKNKYDSIHYELSKTLEMMRNIVLNVKDPEVYEQELRRTAIKLTDQIIGGMKRIRSTDLESYQKIRDYLRAKPGITISEKDRADLKDYNAFRKRNMGRINLTNNGVPVDTAYQEMQSLYGEGYFPSDITHPADQLLRMEEIMQTLEPVYENFSSYEIAEMKEYMASDIENEILDIVMGDAIKSVPQTKADEIAAKYEKKIAGMEKSFNERLAAMQAENKKKINKIVDRERESRAKSEQKIRDYYREADAERRARRADSDARTRLLKIARRLSNKKLPTPNKALIQQYIGDMDLIAKSMTRQTLDRLSDLKLWYDTEKANNPDFRSDPGIEQKLERLSKWRISELSANEVLELTKVLRNIENEIRNQGRLIEEEDRRQVAIMAEEVVRDVGQTKGTKNIITKKDDPDDVNILLKKLNPRNLDNLFVMGTLSPERAIRRMTGYNDSDPLYKATKSLSAGQRKMLDFQMRANKMFSKWMDDKAFMESISGKKAKLIEIRPGVKITPDMRMSLYLHLKNDDNLRHITRGGITLPNMALYKRGDMQEAYNFNDEDLMKNKIVLTKSEIEKIVSGMSEKEKAFADEAAKYFGGMSQKAINETSNLLKGYPAAEVKNYFPINTDRNFTATDFEAIKQDGTIEGMGFLKERVPASQPIYLRDMTDVLKQSIDMTGKYVGLAIPVRNFYKLWGAVLRERDPNTGQILSPQPKGSVKEAISTRWGEPGTKYIENMIADMQNRRTDTQAWSKVFRKLRSNYARGVLELNASVAMKQAASYPTAAAVLGWKPILQALKDVKKVDPELIDNYTPLLNYRKKGYAVQEIGDIKQQGMKLPKALNWISGMDVATTTKLWKASEYYVRDYQKDLKVGSEDYYKAVAEIYNRVIEETQPNYTTMQRPGVLRQTDSLVSSLLMFKTQPFQNFNIVYDAIGNWRAKERQYKQNTNAVTEAAMKAARRDAANAITSQIGQLIVFAGMTFAWAMFRGKKEKYEDKDGEMTFGSVMKALGKDMAGNALSGIPFGSDAWEYLSSWVFKDKYYGFDVSTASSLSDLTSALTKAKDGVTDISKNVFGKDADLSDINWREKRLELQDVVYGAAKAFGVPVENVDKLLGAIFRYASGAAVGNLKGEYAYLVLTESETTSDDGINKKYADLLYKAYRKDPELYEKIYYDLEEKVGSEKIKKAMENRMREEQGVSSVNELDQRYMTPNAQADYEALLDPVRESKIWDKASPEAQGKLEKKLYEIAMETKPGAEYQQKMDAFEENGFDNTTWMLYQLALSIADEKGNANGSPDNTEKEAAIRMLGLTWQQSRDLWQMQSNAKTDKNNPWKK